MGIEILLLVYAGIGLGSFTVSFGFRGLRRRKLPLSMFSERVLADRAAKVMSVVCIIVGIALVGFIVVMIQMFPTGLR